MCDLFSWIELDKAESKKHGGCSVLFLTDETVAILRGRKTGREWDDNDVVGHSAIEAYYDCTGRHAESSDVIPPVMAEMYKSGAMDKMVTGILGKDRKAWPKFDEEGNAAAYSVGRFHEDPDWIRKSIAYYCDNYKLDGKDLVSKKAGAIETYRAKKDRGNVDRALTWTDTPQGHKFWAGLYFLQKGDCRGDVGDCKPWTPAEKKMIAAMPEVKR